MSGLDSAILAACGLKQIKAQRSVLEVAGDFAGIIRMLRGDLDLALKVAAPGATPADAKDLVCEMELTLESAECILIRAIKEQVGQ